jgi:hypothetical protein
MSAQVQYWMEMLVPINGVPPGPLLARQPRPLDVQRPKQSSTAITERESDGYCEALAFAFAEAGAAAQG